MPITFRYDPERDLLIHIGVGPVSMADIDSLRQERQEAGVPWPVYHTLSDMRRATFAFDIATLKEHEQAVSEEELAGVRQAEIAADPKTTAILLIWREYLPEGVLVEIFSTVEAAYEWLGVEPRDGDLDP